MWLCPYCESANEDQENFCAVCSFGRDVQYDELLYCTKCGISYVVSDNNMYCTRCGMKLLDA